MFTSLKYTPSFLISSLWLPCSTMTPSSNPAMTSAFRIVDSRWAITMVVRPSLAWKGGQTWRSRVTTSTHCQKHAQVSTWMHVSAVNESSFPRGTGAHRHPHLWKAPARVSSGPERRPSPPVQRWIILEAHGSVGLPKKNQRRSDPSQVFSYSSEEPSLSALRQLWASAGTC